MRGSRGERRDGARASYAKPGGRSAVALAWLLQKPGITAPIIGAGKPEHLTDAVAAVSLILSADEIAELEAPYLPHPVSGI